MDHAVLERPTAGVSSYRFVLDEPVGCRLHHVAEEGVHVVRYKLGIEHHLHHVTAYRVVTMPMPNADTGNTHVSVGAALL